MAMAINKRNNVSKQHECITINLIYHLYSEDPASSRSKQSFICEEPSIQDHLWWNVWYLWKIRSNTSNTNVSILNKENSLDLHPFLHRGNTPETRGTAFVVYEDIFDAKNACDHLSGFNVCNRYLVVLYYQPNKAFKKTDIEKKAEEINNIKTKYNIGMDK